MSGLVRTTRRVRAKPGSNRPPCGAAVLFRPPAPAWVFEGATCERPVGHKGKHRTVVEWAQT